MLPFRGYLFISVFQSWPNVKHVMVLKCKHALGEDENMTV